MFEFVKLAELYYAGSHGMDIKGPAKGSRHTRAAKGVLFQPASQFLPMIEQVLVPSPIPWPPPGACFASPIILRNALNNSMSSSGARVSGGEDQEHPWSQGGEQQVLRLRPLQMRR